MSEFEKKVSVMVGTIIIIVGVILLFKIMNNVVSLFNEASTIESYDNMTDREILIENTLLSEYVLIIVTSLFILIMALIFFWAALSSGFKILFEGFGWKDTEDEILDKVNELEKLIKKVKVKK